MLAFFFVIKRKNTSDYDLRADDLGRESGKKYGFGRRGRV